MDPEGILLNTSDRGEQILHDTIYTYNLKKQNKKPELVKQSGMVVTKS